ncbi:APC family permease, partial [Pseudomonas sp. FW305-130]
ITLVLLAIAVINLFTKPQATIAGVSFSIFLFIVFTVSEKYTHKARGAVAHVEMDQFHLATEGVLTPEAVGARPGNIVVPVSNIHSV